MKLDLSKIIGLAQIVGGLVQSATSLAGKTGQEKHDIVVQAATDLLPALEGVTQSDIADNTLYAQALSNLVNAEHAANLAREAFAALIADIKAKKVA